MKHYLACLLLSSVFFTSCHFFHRNKVRGDGNITTEARSVSNFSKVDVSGGIDVYLKQDTAYSVKVEIDNNLQEYIDVYTEGETLRIHQADNTDLSTSERIKVYVSAPDYNQLHASGSCNFISQNQLNSAEGLKIHVSGASEAMLDVKTPSVNADLSGSCTLSIKGEAKDFDVSGSGSTTIRAFGLMTENSEIDISGSGNAEVYASAKLDVGVSGSGDVQYKGNAVVNQRISGSGNVKKVD